MLGYSALSWIGSFKRSSQVVFHISDLLFWAEYYRTTQDIGLLTIAVGQRRPVWISQTCIVQRQYLSQTSRGFELKIDHYVWRPQFWPLELLGLDALIRETYSSWPWPILIVGSGSSGLVSWATRTGRSHKRDLLFVALVYPGSRLW